MTSVETEPLTPNVIPTPLASGARERDMAGTQSTFPSIARSPQPCWPSLALLTPAHAVEPGEMLKDPALEARARHISQELRCLVCQNQSIDDSNAELARDLRLLVRERLAAGDSDAAVLAFVEARYGEFVLLRPRRQAAHGPAVAGAAPAAGRHCLRTSSASPARAGRQAAAGANAEPLSPAEQQRLDDLLKKPRS